MDNCSGLESVKAVLHDRAGNFERKVELKLTDTEIVNIGGGDRCTIYTYSHLSDPFYIPFEGCDVEPLEIVYNAFDGCNHSYWRDRKSVVQGKGVEARGVEVRRGIRTR